MNSSLELIKMTGSNNINVGKGHEDISDLIIK